MAILDTEVLFPVGLVVQTAGVAEAIPTNDTLVGIWRHTRGDWGDVSKQDKESNNDALVNERRILSSYTSSNGKKFWIITEHDRSLTTVLLPQEY